MKAKKSPKANLENKRFIFAQIGMIISLTLILLAFEWKSYDDYTFLRPERIDRTVEEMAQIVVQKKVPPMPKTKFYPSFTIVDDDKFIDDEVEIFNIEGDENTTYESYMPDNEDEPTVNDVPVYMAQEMPEFPDGETERIRFLEKNLDYPDIAVETGIAGNVYVTFVVEKDGSITNIDLLKGIGGGCDEEAMRIVGLMPIWIPGKQNGHPVRVRLNMHIRFKLLSH